MNDGDEDPALLAYRSARRRIKQMLAEATHAVKNMEGSHDFDKAEVGDLSDAESEFHGGVQQIVGNLDQISQDDPLRSYNIAVGVIFSLRGYLRMGSILRPSATTTKIAKRQQQRRAVEGASKARKLKDKSLEDRIIDQVIADRLEAWGVDGRKITNAALQKEVEQALGLAGIDRTVSEATIYRRRKALSSPKVLNEEPLGH